MAVTPTQIVQHLQKYLPRLTDRFTEVLSVSSAVMGASNILTVTSAGHGKSPGDNIVITAGTTRNTLTAATLQADDTVTFTTTYDHDLIRPTLAGDDQTLAMAGFAGIWDGDHDINDVSNRRNFNVPLPSGETLAPTLDGNQYLIDNIPLGVWAIDTTPTADTFTIDMSESVEQPQSAVDGLTIISGFRIAAAANFKRAQAAYSEQGNGDFYLFVIMTDTDVSKDRHTLNDGVAGLTAQDERLLRLLNNFSTAVFIPTTGDLAGGAAQDFAYGELSTALIGSLFCAPFNSGSLVPYLTVPVGHGPGEYNSAYYVHVYDWQAPTVINYSDGLLDPVDTAFRDIEQTIELFGDEDAEMLLNIDLDDDPIIPT